MEDESMVSKNDAGKKITATVGTSDHAIITRVCKARGISVSQWVQENIAEGLYKAVASGYLGKVEVFTEKETGGEGEQEDSVKTKKI